MKRYYSSPETTTMAVSHQLLQASKLNMSSTGGDGEVMVKSQTPSTPSYNVWNDDWSQ